MPTPAVGSLLLLSNENLDMISDSHSQAVFPGEALGVQDPRRGHVLPWCCFAVHKLRFIQGQLFGESPSVDSY